MANGILAASQIQMESLSGTGVITVVPPATNINRTLTLPDSTGTVSTMGVGTAVSASGTSVDFTGIPSWVKRITVMFSGVSTSGTDAIWIQLGDTGGIETTGYVSVNTSQSGVVTTSTSAFIAGLNNPATDNANGVFNLALLGSNTWLQSGIFAENGTSRIYTGAGSKALSDTLTQIRITTSGGTQTFDAGTINIMYEG